VRVLLFGAGATGSILGARLFRAGVPVQLVARPEHVRAIDQNGLTVEGLEGGPFRIPAATEVPEGEFFDRIILTVKARDIDTACASLARSLVHPAPVLLLQNGLGIRAQAIAALSRSGWAYAPKWVTRGIQIVAATFLGPGRVRLAGDGEILLGDDGLVGGLNGFDALLAGAQIPVRVVESIAREEWRKALVNAAINPLTADHGFENGRLAEEPFRGLALALTEEARQVAAAEGFAFTPEEAEQELFRIIRATATNRTSMLQDLEAGRPTEIDAISGRILEKGRQHGLTLPHTQRMVERIRARERTATAGRSAAGPPGAGA
jgi:2-dehydropantoate 2-reductase